MISAAQFAPKGVTVSSASAGGAASGALCWSAGFGARMAGMVSAAQLEIDRQCVRLCEPYLPMPDGVPVAPGFAGTVPGSGMLVYEAQGALEQYFGNESNGARGPLWFARMKADHQAEILESARRKVGEAL